MTRLALKQRLAEKRKSKKVQEVGPASSVGPGWRSQGANIGTGAVVEPDTKEIARDWAKSVGTRDRKAWDEHATRMGCSPEAIEDGWEFLQRRDNGQEESAAQATFAKIRAMRQAEDTDPAAIATLKKVFGESTSWTGFWVPTQALLDPNTNTDPKIERKKSKRRSESINVMAVKTHQAPQVGNARGQAQIANQDPGFPFRTSAAKQVWDTAQQLILLYPTNNAGEILSMAVRESGVLATELTPEDEQLLKMAVEYLQNGAPPSNVRTGGTPGGPFRSQGDGHSLGIRGTMGLP